jgi:hypothetical protein
MNIEVVELGAQSLAGFDPVLPLRPWVTRRTSACANASSERTRCSTTSPCSNGL